MRIMTKFADVGRISEEMSKIKSIKAIYLFGSYARGKNGSLSDIDLCIIGNLTRREELEVLGYGSDNLDISLFSRIPLMIQFRVLREGKLLFCRDEKEIRSVKVSVLREYLDYSGFMNHFYRRLLKNV